ncbi:hypothetical protein CVT26_015226 [Gymnopilus dilepis]|uniref:CBM1 domain-containing protein n=1 Tax=Gymnopilus dilepis TaxID=231916 RepID=A0A409W479_9AGAR|nr:hypothetical protein CVT26_015226 [Gymnopilus dilepis]
MFPRLLFAVSMFLVSTVAQVYVPPPGLFCCPPVGPDGLPLAAQQQGPFNLFCEYGTDQQCIYNPATGAGATIAGCPPQAIPNPHPPTCPV